MQLDRRRNVSYTTCIASLRDVCRQLQNVGGATRAGVKLRPVVAPKQIAFSSPSLFSVQPCDWFCLDLSQFGRRLGVLQLGSCGFVGLVMILSGCIVI